MKEITENEKLMLRAADVCLDRNIPFALYSAPRSGRLRFMACLPADVANGVDPDTDDCFFISRFGADEPFMAGVKNRFDAAGILAEIASAGDTAYPRSSERPYLHSTFKASWENALGKVRKRFRKLGGKVVFSIHDSIFSTRPLIEIFEEYRAYTPANFSYLCFTPQTGVWFGSTPELLLETGPDADQFRTMALAGTRWEASGPWDEKNMLEHAVVREFIDGILTLNSLQVSVGKTVTLENNGVEHLMTPIEARGKRSFRHLLTELNPTPAVAGFPRDVALAEIDLFESHQRRCYAGVAGVSDGGQKAAYVNLRCAFAAQAETPDGHQGWVHNVYVGGGIMPDSDSRTEWEELKRKEATLMFTIAGGKTTEPDVIYDPVDVTFK